MPKLKDLLPGIFGSHGKGQAKTPNGGRLETDAVPLGNDDNEPHQPLGPSTSTVSADLTESVVRELTDPNYNSLELVESVSAGPLVQSGGGVLAVPQDNDLTMNTMNVNNAQQQVVMQFSNVSNIQFGSVYHFNSGIGTSTNSLQKGASGDSLANGLTMSAAGVEAAGKRQRTPKTTSIVAMMQSLEEPNHRMLDTIATHLGEGWKQVMRDLGQSEGQIDQAVIDHQMHGGIKEVIYQLLLQWTRNADDGVGTLGHITTLLWETKHRDCVQRMKLVWKSEVKRKTSR